MLPQKLIRLLIAGAIAIGAAGPAPEALAAGTAAAPVSSARAFQSPLIHPHSWPAGYPAAGSAMSPMAPAKSRPKAARRVAGAAAAARSTALAPPSGPGLPTPALSSAQGPRAVTDMTLFRSTAIPTGGASTVAEPSVAENGRTIFYTGNWFDAYSTDAGASFTNIDPFTKFTPPAGQRFCCDQRVVYDPGHDIFIWLIQYYNNGTTNGASIDRLAIASTAGVASGNWFTYDVSPVTALFPSGDWLDYPDLAVGSTFAYMTTNVFNGASWDGTTIMRFPLATLAAHLPVAAGVYRETNAGGHFNFTPTDGANTTMYFASHEGFFGNAGGHTYANQLRVYSWTDASVTGPTSIAVSITRWPSDTLACAPGSVTVAEWCGDDDGRIQAGWVEGGLVSFMWDASQDLIGNIAPGFRPFPYIRVARITIASMTAAADADLFSSTNAWAYGSASLDARGDFGVSAQWGDLTHFPSSTVLVHDANSGGGYSPIAVRAGAASPTTPANRWGDYLTVHPTSPATNSWVATSYTIQAGNASEPRLVWFGRQQDDPFRAVVTGASVAAQTGVSTGTAIVAHLANPIEIGSEYSASIDWGDCSAPTTGSITGAASPFSVSGSHVYTQAGTFTVTTTVTDSLGLVASGSGSAVVVGTGYTYDASSTQQYTLNGSDGATWQTVDPVCLSLAFSAPVAGFAVLGGNADLFTSVAAYNQDIGISVTGPGYPSVPGQPEAWKESGGYAGIYSPNAAYVQSVIPVTAGQSYTARLVWKSNRPANGVSIYMAAGAIAPYSPTRLTAHIVPTAQFFSAVTTTQPTLNNGATGAGSDGVTWADLGVSLPPIIPAADSQALIGGNADLWTGATSFNQDIGIEVNGTLVAWKESGGFGGTFSPNAAYVQTVFSMTQGIAYNVKLVWKTNRPDTTAISAGAGPIGGFYSPTRLSAELIPNSASALTSSVVTTQPVLGNTVSSIWNTLSSGPAPVVVNPTADGLAIISANADLWTYIAGYNQDIGLWISGGGYTSPTLITWKESGGFAGTFSPNAAFITAVVPVQSGQTYTVTLKWTTNRNDPNQISAGAGPLIAGTLTTYSPTRLSVQLSS